MRVTATAKGDRRGRPARAAVHRHNTVERERDEWSVSSHRQFYELVKNSDDENYMSIWGLINRQFL